MRLVHPRLAVHRLMALVLLVALDLGVLGVFSTRGVRPPRSSFLIALGGLPMANILAMPLIASLPTRRADFRRRPGLIGFLGAGGVSLGLFLIAASATSWPMLPSVDSAMHRLGLGPKEMPSLLAMPLVFLFPQLSIALLGAGIARVWASRVAVVPERDD